MSDVIPSTTKVKPLDGRLRHKLGQANIISSNNRARNAWSHNARWQQVASATCCVEEDAGFINAQLAVLQ